MSHADKPTGRIVAIAQAAKVCQGWFVEALDKLPGRLTELEPVAIRADLEVDYGQFRAWARSLGAFARDEASLDFRLRDTAAVQKTVINLLDRISQSLEKCIALATAEAYNSNILQHDSLSPSETSASDSDECEREEPKIWAASYECKERLKTVSRSLENLAKIAVGIRKSGIASRTSRALLYERWENGINLTEQFEKEFLPKVLSRDGIEEPLKSRLTAAIALRRRTFEYQREHHRKLSYGFDESQTHHLRTLHNQTSNYQNKDSTAILASLVRFADGSESHLGSASVQGLEPPSTRASYFDTVRSETVSNRSIPRGSTASSTSHRRNLNLPKPPNVPQNAKYFECPYCCMLVSVERLRKASWRNHVTNDLRPFVCLHPECDTPDKEFSTQNEWYEHHKWQHALNWWCDGDQGNHALQVFSDRVKFENHLSEQHATMHLNESQLRMFVNISATPALVVFDSCPFCDYHPLFTETDAESADTRAVGKAAIDEMHIQRKLQNHIASEMLNLFLYALPDREDISECDSASRLDASHRSTIAGLKESIFEPGDQIKDYQNSNTDLGIPDTDEDWTAIEDWKQPADADISDEVDPIIKKFFDAKSKAQEVEDKDTMIEQTKDQAGSQNQLLESFDFEVDDFNKLFSADDLSNDFGTELDELSEFERFLNWLNAPDASMDQQKTYSKVTSDNHQWFFETSAYRDWISQDNSLIWLNGIAGCGKTVLCSTAIQRALFDRKSRRSIGVAFFYFSLNDGSKQSASAMLSALILQLSHQVSDPLYLLPLFEMHGPGSPSLYALMECLLRVIPTFQHAYLFVDAIDEIPLSTHRFDALSSLRDLRDSKLPGLHLLLASRDEPDIRDTINPSRSENFSMNKNGKVPLYQCPPDYFSPEFIRVHRENADFVPAQANLFLNIGIADLLGTWMDDADAFRLATNGKSHEDVFKILPYPIEERETPVKKFIREDPSVQFHGAHPVWPYIVSDRNILENDFVGEIVGSIGHIEDYKADPFNDWDRLRHPAHFVFFHPHLPLYIDCRAEGTIMRYTRRSCRPNVKIETLITGARDLHFCLVATNDIPQGAEITIAWDVESDPQMRDYLNRLATSASSVDDSQREYISHFVGTVLAHFGDCACEQAYDDPCIIGRFDRRLTNPLSSSTAASARGIALGPFTFIPSYDQNNPIPDPEDDMAIPHSKENLYYFNELELKSEDLSRFQEIFHQLCTIIQDSDLKNHLKEIDIGIKMIGASKSSARPTIVVSCLADINQHLLRVCCSKAITNHSNLPIIVRSVSRSVSIKLS